MSENPPDDTFNQLLRDLQSDEAIVRKHAVIALGRSGNVRALVPLIKLARIYKPDWETQLAISKAIGNLQGEGAVEQFAQALEHLSVFEQFIRNGVITALTKLGEPGLDVLLCALHHHDKEVRRNVIIGLGKIQNHRTIVPLVSVLHDTDEDTNVRAMAAISLGRNLDKRAIEPLIVAFHDENSRVRRAATSMLAGFRQVSDYDIVNLLTTALQDADNQVRAEAAGCLGWRGNIRAIKYLTSALSDTDHRVRYRAAMSLVAIRDKQVIDPLFIALKDGYWLVRKKVVYAIDVTDWWATDLLIFALKDNHWLVRRDATFKLSAMGDRRAVEPLITLLSHPVDYVYQNAARTLEEIGTDEALAAVAQWRAGQDSAE